MFNNFIYEMDFALGYPTRVGYKEVEADTGDEDILGHVLFQADMKVQNKLEKLDKPELIWKRSA